MVTGFKLNPQAMAKWRGALQELARISKKDDPEGVQKLATLSARRFVQNVASVTPPGTGRLDSAAKKRGEQAILSDLLKIAVPAQALQRVVSDEVFTSAQELIEAHARARVNSNGRVNPRNRREKLLVNPADFNRVLRTLQAKVGWLAAGLNAAAARLGFALPSWIRRHGEHFGRIDVKATGHGIQIRIVQNVKFAENVQGYPRHWNFALNKEISSLIAQAKAVHAKHAGRAKARLH